MIFTQSPGWSSSLPWCCNCCPVISYPDVPRCIRKKRIAKACLAYLPHDLALMFRRVLNRQNQGNSRPQPGAEEVEAKTSPASVSRCKLCIGGGRGFTSECHGTSQANPCHPPIRSGSAFRDHFPGGFTKCYPHFTHPLSRPISYHCPRASLVCHSGHCFVHHCLGARILCVPGGIRFYEVTKLCQAPIPA